MTQWTTIPISSILDRLLRSRRVQKLKDKTQRMRRQVSLETKIFSVKSNLTSDLRMHNSHRSVCLLWQEVAEPAPEEKVVCGCCSLSLVFDARDCLQQLSCQVSRPRVSEATCNLNMYSILFFNYKRNWMKLFKAWYAMCQEARAQRIGFLRTLESDNKFYVPEMSPSQMFGPYDFRISFSNLLAVLFLDMRSWTVQPPEEVIQAISSQDADALPSKIQVLLVGNFYVTNVGAEHAENVNKLHGTNIKAGSHLEGNDPRHVGYRNYIYEIWYFHGQNPASRQKYNLVQHIVEQPNPHPFEC